ncbi:cysteine hydrolase [Streptomyces sp. ICN988]|uniref:cysteine hydrolase family protein n=1 Tax=Streptomyces TaxID=1883 RepID=UPI0018D9D90C|nr:MULTISPECIES: isochorismatase family protein [Streptomyces]MBH5133134.1 cysteine hydrolase [Streptomyces sp. HB-N217]MCV2462076.1 cysteine hydrolase [Streptomyces sp. ICN988]MDU0256505.1 isochorismatase family protein [Streptomyces sp. PU10]WSU01048.1 cysteine hydrolase [Streptomyces sp. NBC_01124]
MPPTAALLVIDMQNTTVAMAHRAAETVAAIAGLSERARAAGVPVVTVRQRDEGMVPGTEGWQVVPELAPREGEPVVDKTTPDSFLGTGLDETLRALGVTEVIVTGFATEVCVDTTARQALSRGYDLVVVADGHTTSVRTEEDVDLVPADRSIAQANAVYRMIGWPGRRIRVRAAADVDFAAPEGAPGVRPA